MNGHCLVGWDIGGAHLKAVGVSAPGRVSLALQLPAPVWRGLDILHEAMNEILYRLPAAEHRHAVTMTGELADCFPDRDSGVAALLDCSERLLGSETLVYRPGGLCDLETARAAPGCVASANWHAGAELAGQWYEQAVLLDVGSTTSDIVAIRDGHPAVHGYTDRERLQHDELVYTGVVRTPVMAVAQRAPVAGVDQQLVAEQFAVMADVYRLTGELPAAADQMPTVDGGPRDIQGSVRRLARMAGADLHTASLEDWQDLATHLRDRQLQLLEAALTRVIARNGLDASAVIIGAGCGRFLAGQLADRLGRPWVDAASRIGGETELRERVATMLPAWAMAESLCCELPVT